MNWLLGMLMAGTLLAAAESSVPSGRRHWTSAQGLPQDAVLAMTQTREGYLWLATEGGLARFDGVHFTTFDRKNTPALGSNFVQALAEDAAGWLWIGTAGGGLTRYRDGFWERVTFWPAEAGNTIYALLAAKDGAMWVATEKGLNRIDGDRVKRFTKADGSPEAPVYSVAQAADGAIWFGSYGKGLGRYHHGAVTMWTKANGLADDRVILVVADGGDVWVALYGGGLQRYRDGRLVQTMLVEAAVPDKGIWAMRRDRAGRLWVGSFGAGLGAVLDGRLRFGVDQRVEADSVWSLLEDREGNLWAGTSEGLYQFRHLPITAMTRQDGLPGEVVASVWQTPDRAMWAGTNEGLVRWTEAQPRPVLITRIQVMSKQQDESGALWLGTAGNGLLRLAAGSTAPVSQPGPWGNHPLHAQALDASGTLWVGTFGAGLFSCQTKPFVCQAVGSAKSDRVMALLPTASGDLWVGTREGLALRRGGKWRQFTTADGLGSNLITALYQDEDGSVWIGSEGGGLARYFDGQITKVGSGQGLFDDILYSIREDGAGRLWMGSPRGIFRVDKKQVIERRFPLTSVAYGLLDGMLSTQCFADTPNAAARTADGALWFGTMKGLVRVDPARLRINPVPPPVLLEEVLVDGVAMPARGVVDVPAGSRRLEVAYTALSLTVPEKQRFRYRLEGYDDRWVEAGANRTLSYTNLPFGTYQLVVLASNDDGVWNQSGTRLTIRWRPHFYQTAWFLVLMLAATAGVIIAVYRYRIAQVEARYRIVLAERTRIAREIHDTYLQGFTGITLQLDALSRGLPHGETGERMSRLLQQADSTLREARESIWNLRRLDSPSCNLLDQVQTTLETVFAPAGLSYSLQIEGDFPAVAESVRAEWQRVVQEAASNVVRHARATNVDIRLCGEAKLCRFVMQDDGIGFDFHAASSGSLHFGLRGMVERCQALGGSCRVVSEPGSGTCVEIVLPWSAPHYL